MVSAGRCRDERPRLRGHRHDRAGDWTTTDERARRRERRGGCDELAVILGALQLASDGGLADDADAATDAAIAAVWKIKALADLMLGRVRRETNSDERKAG